jgi:eukaryotic-like serine/threonine-protein kinase
VRFGRYEILARLAEGGMGEVFRARLVGEAGFEKPVALKRVFAHLSADVEYRELFIREAKVTARLVHPNIVQVYELGTEAGQLFIAMEFVDGTDLASFAVHQLQQGGIDSAMLALIARDVLEGLAFAHSLTDDDGRPRPVVHRDISPQNILLSTGGIAKICDFGIARAALTETTRTDIFSGRRVGKLAFMPPEQARGGLVDARSDVFAVGVTLWVAATGVKFYADEMEEEKVKRGKPLPPKHLTDVWPDAPLELAAIVDRAVQFDPGDRFQTASEFARALDGYLMKRGTAAARDALRELVQDMRHTVIQRPLGAGGTGDTDPEPARPTRIDMPARGAPTRVAAPRAQPARPPRLTEADQPTVVSGLAQAVTPRVTEGELTAPFQTPETLVATHPQIAVARRNRSVLVVVAALAVAATLALVVWVSTRGRPRLVETVVTPVAIVPEMPRVVEPVPVPPTPEAVAPVVVAAEPPALERPPVVRERPRVAPKPVVPKKQPVGYLTLHVQPWARVTIDGEEIPGKTPLLEHPLAAGKRWITLTGPDGKSSMIVVDVKPGETVTRSVTLD